MLTGRFWVPWTWAFCHKSEGLKAVCLRYTAFDEGKDIVLKCSFGLGVTAGFSFPSPPHNGGFVLHGGEDGIQRTTLPPQSMSFMWVCRNKKELVDLTSKDLILITAFFTQIRNRSICTKENGDLFDVTRLGIGPKIIFLVYEGWKTKMVMSSVAEIWAGAF